MFYSSLLVVEKNLDFNQISEHSSNEYFTLIRVESKKEKKVYTVKKIKKSEENFEFLNEEIKICKNLKNKLIPKILRMYEDQSHFYLLYDDFLDGGKELFDYVVEHGCVDEKFSKKIVTELIEFLMLLHDNCILFLFLKIINFIFIFIFIFN